MKIIDNYDKKIENKKLNDFIKKNKSKLDKLEVIRHEDGTVQYWISYYTKKETEKILDKNKEVS
jgi:hypothetical protein